MKVVLETQHASREDEEALLRCWKSVQGFSVKEIQHALGKLVESREDAAAEEIRGMLYFRWGQLDPLGAIAAAGDSEVFKVAAFTAWANRDPEAAYRWSLETPGGAQQGGLAFRVAPVLLLDGPAMALERATAMGKPVLDEVLMALARSEAGDPGKREAFLKLLAESGDAQAAAAGSQFVFKRWAEVDPQGAMKAAVAEDAPPGVRTLALVQWARNDPAAACEWAGGHADAVSLPDRLEVYEAWLKKTPEDAGRWLDSNVVPPEFHAEMSRRILSGLIRAEGRPAWTGPPGGAQTVSSLQAHFSRWQSVQPQESGRWLETVNPDIREKLKGEGR